MIKLFHKIHLWLSVPFGIIITLICFSGAMLVFEPEITQSIKSDVYYVTSAEKEPISMSVLMETVKASLPDSVSITGVTVFADKNRTYQVNLSKPRRASVFIDQYSGKITGKYERIGFFGTMFKLHRWLLDSANPRGDGIKIGKLIVGISTIIFVIALISGVVIWLPRLHNGLIRSLAITTKKGWRGFWRSFHVAGGMYAFIVVLIMALTGLTWSFNWYRTAFYTVCGVEYTPRNLRNNTIDKKGHIKREHQHSEFGCWQQVYNELKTQNPDAPQITIGLENASVTLGTIGNERASDTYVYDHNSGEITPSIKYADSVPADKLRGWIYSMHTGNFGGLLTRILWFLGALLGASLPITGYYLWIKKLFKNWGS